MTPPSQEASSTRYNKRLFRDDDGGDDRDATDKNILPLPKKRCVRDVTSSLKKMEFGDSKNNDQTADSFSTTANATSSYTALYTASFAMTCAKERSCAMSYASISKDTPKGKATKQIIRLKKDWYILLITNKRIMVIRMFLLTLKDTKPLGNGSPTRDNNTSSIKTINRAR
jgi:hypothetical protein